MERFKKLGNTYVKLNRKKRPNAITLNNQMI